MTPLPHVVIDTQTSVASFGLALWDTATGRVAADGLVVRVAPQVAGRTLAPVDASPNRQGIFVVHRLPLAGLDSPPASLLIQVDDRFERFVSFVMHVAGAGEPGLVAPPCLAGLDVGPADSPPLGGFAPPAFVPLFSTPARTPPTGSAVVRASLVDSETRGPAAFAVLEVRDAGRVLGRGVADTRGEVAVSFPYPEPSVLPRWSPPARPAPPVPLTAQSWPLELAVRYRRHLPRYRVAATGSEAPDLCELLAQPLTTLATASPPLPMTEITLRYGQELVLGGPNGDPLLVDVA